MKVISSSVKKEMHVLIDLYESSIRKRVPDSITVYGGDGTFLEASHMYPHKLLVGINMGSRGALLSPLIKGSGEEIERYVETFQVKSLPRIKAKFPTPNGGTREVLVVNEVYMERASSQTAHIQIPLLCDSSIVCDGIMVATPQGSTAYNQNAGGPLLHPNSGALVITGVAARGFTPTVISQKTEVSLFADTQNGKRPCHLVLDGQVYEASEVSISEGTPLCVWCAG